MQDTDLTRLGRLMGGDSHHLAAYNLGLARGQIRQLNVLKDLAPDDTPGIFLRSFEGGIRYWRHVRRLAIEELAEASKYWFQDDKYVWREVRDAGVPTLHP